MIVLEQSAKGEHVSKAPNTDDPIVIEKLVRKDEADKAFAEEVKTAARGCTCGTHIPCIMRVHS